MQILEILVLYAVAILVGGMVFFPSVVAPTVFKSLSEADAGAFLRKLFPTYYVFIIVASAIGAVCLMTRPFLSATLLVIAVSTLGVRQVLVPKINDWRDREMAGDAAAAQLFKTGHRASVMVNLVQMAAAIWVLWQLST